MILAGDIGGTSTRLALYDWKSERVEPVREQIFRSGEYKSLETVLAEFLAPPPAASATDEPAVEPDQPADLSIEAACFGVAGPCVGNRCQTTNLPWVVDGTEVGRRINVPQVRLLNDLEATAYGVLVLRTDEITTLNKGVPPPQPAAMALIAAGTGLGEAMFCWEGSRYLPMASEGGHTDFGPNSDIEIDLLRYLRAQYLHVSYERILSGAGLHAIYEFLRDTKRNEPTWLAERLKAGDPPAVISEVGLGRQAEIAVQALDLFAAIYGAEAGNLALKALALSGLYVGGGIAPKILPKLEEGAFMKNFTNKGRYKTLLSRIPVHVIMNDKAALLGAASMAARLRSATLT